MVFSVSIGIFLADEIFLSMVLQIDPVYASIWLRLSSLSFVKMNGSAKLLYSTNPNDLCFDTKFVQGIFYEIVT